jgi:hypothetical protein
VQRKAETSKNIKNEFRILTLPLQAAPRCARQARNHEP